MNDNALRKKLMGLGIPNGGPRILMEKRHMEWVNLVNANCDSNKPRTKRELLKDIETWDRSQGRQISGGLSSLNDSNAVMRRDFDGVAWSANHTDDFQKLISQARPKLDHNNEPNTKTTGTMNNAISHHTQPDWSLKLNEPSTDVSNNLPSHSEQPFSNGRMISDSNSHSGNPNNDVDI